jgi:hypothetical protein
MDLKMNLNNPNSVGSLASRRGLLMMPSLTSLRHVACDNIMVRYVASELGMGIKEVSRSSLR